MIKHKCNDVVLPVLPEEPDYPYSIVIAIGTQQYIYDTNEMAYAVVYSKMQFVVVGQFIIYFVEDNEWKLYKTISAGTKWEEQLLKPSDSTSAIAPLCYTSQYVWCGADVLEYKEPNFYVYKSGTSPIEIEAADEPIVYSLFASAYTYTIGATPTPLMIVVDSTNSDGGTISFAWHKLVNGQDGGVVGTEQNFYPPTDVLGSTEYYCIVRNTLNNTATIVISANTSVVTIVNPRNGRVKIIGYILKELGVPCAEVIGDKLCNHQTTNSISTYGMRRSSVFEHSFTTEWISQKIEIPENFNYELLH